MGHSQRDCSGTLSAAIQLTDIINLLNEETDLVYASTHSGLSIFDHLIERQQPRRIRNVASFDTIFAREFDHRAIEILQLVVLLNRNTSRAAWSKRQVGTEDVNISRLASVYRALTRDGDMTLYQSHEEIHKIVGGLVSIFGTAAGGIALQLDMLPLMLNGLKRRCLALLIGDLTISLLKHSMERRCGGVLRLRSEPQTNAQIHVFVETSLCIEASMKGPGYENIARLAGALNAEMIYRQNARGGTAIEIAIPLKLISSNTEVAMVYGKDNVQQHLDYLKTI